MNWQTPAVPGKNLAAIVALGAILAACAQKEPTAPPATLAPTDAAAPTPTPEPEPTIPAAAASEPAAAQVEASLALTPEDMEALLAPIALYPDPVLAQVLAAATNPQMVLDAGNWLIENPDLKGRTLDEAAQPLGFSPSMRALLQFPEVVDMMCMKLDWTTQLGEAFSTDQAGALDAVQRLRRQSADVGNLTSSEQLKVETEVQDGKEVITVEPADPKVVYVPRYDPVAVYAPPPATIPPPTTTTVVEEKKGFSTGAMVTTGLLSFGAGLLVAEIFDDDDDWDDYRPNYGYGGIYYGGRPYYPPPPGYYRPPYGGSYRPGYGYNRPPNWGNSFDNNTIIVNNQGNDYWNKYGNRPGATQKRPSSPISKARSNRPELQGLDQQQRTRQAQAKAQPRPAAGDRSAGWQGQSGYAGARDKAKPAARPGTSDRAAAAAPAKGKVQGQYAGARPAGQAARDKMVAGRPVVPAAGGTGSRAPGQGKVDRGYSAGSGQTRQTGQQQASRQAQPQKQNQNRQAQPQKQNENRQAQPQNQNRQAQLQKQNQNRQAQPQKQNRQARPAPMPSANRSGGGSPLGGSGFSSASKGGNDRAASQRGRQSMPQGARSKGGGANRSGAGKSRG